MPMGRLEDLAGRHPEWQPWLGVVGGVLEQMREPLWDGAVPADAPARRPGVPLLAGARVSFDERLARFFDQVVHSAAHSGAPGMKGLQSSRYTEEGAAGALQAALDGDDARLEKLAVDAGAEPMAFCAVAVLVPMPLLHAYARCWAAHLQPGWSEGYCPLCGAWPAFAEVCGVERTRYLRCARCGSAWQASCLSCAYCGMIRHDELASFVVAEQGGAAVAIEACNGCRGYLKTFTALRTSAPEHILIEDLGSVALDLVASERGYRRPPGLGRALDVAMVRNGTGAPAA